MISREYCEHCQKEVVAESGMEGMLSPLGPTKRCRECGHDTISIKKAQRRQRSATQRQAKLDAYQEQVRANPDAYASVRILSVGPRGLGMGAAHLAVKEATGWTLDKASAVGAGRIHLITGLEPDKAKTLVKRLNKRGGWKAEYVPAANESKETAPEPQGAINAAPTAGQTGVIVQQTKVTGKLQRALFEAVPTSDQAADLQKKIRTGPIEVHPKSNSALETFVAKLDKLGIEYELIHDRNPSQAEAVPEVQGSENEKASAETAGTSTPEPKDAQESAETHRPSDDVFAQIKKLGELHGAGLLTDEEFQDKKSELLQRL